MARANKGRIRIVFATPLSRPTQTDIKQHLKATLLKWIKILHLEDWQITVKVMAPKDFNNDVSAKVDGNFTYMFATIYFNAGTPKRLYDEVISHELLHLIIGSFTYYLEYFFNERLEPTEKMFFEEKEENIVEKLSRILVKLERKGVRQNEAP